ncbi:MAG: metallophosphoesterase [Prevotella sp.]|nr:metallophosphoesterase [Prevotella sp.]
MNDLLIIPDIHGRTFWREAVETTTWSRAVFLGDYTDPYPHEGISPEEAYNNFIDILHYVIDHREQTVLLLGNHDMHYKSQVFRKLAMGSRYSRRLAERYEYLFATFSGYFSMAYEAEYDGVRCLLTHAGVVPDWYRRHAQLIGELNAENLNHLTESYEGMAALSEIGYIRGGLDPCGGPLWADCNEMGTLDNGLFQIFGHTQSFDGQPVVTPSYACVDTHRAYLLSEVLAMR